MMIKSSGSENCKILRLFSFYTSNVLIEVLKFISSFLKKSTLTERNPLSNCPNILSLRRERRFKQKRTIFYYFNLKWEKRKISNLNSIKLTCIEINWNSYDKMSLMWRRSILMRFNRSNLINYSQVLLLYKLIETIFWFTARKNLMLLNLYENSTLNIIRNRKNSLLKRL